MKGNSGGMKTSRTSRTFRITRDSVLFVAGLGIIIQQTAVGSAASERPYLLAVAAAMVGLPVFSQLTSRGDDR